MKNRLNILYIHCHDAGRYLSPYGYPMPTPNLQKFAEQGTFFRKAFCAAPTCSPSRACLLTSQYAHVNGMLGLNHRGWQLNDYKQHLAWHLRENGYQTVLSGVQHELNPHVDDVYETNLNLAIKRRSGCGMKYYDRETAEAAAGWINGYEGDEPFFMACGFFYPHRKYYPRDSRYNPNYLKIPDPLPDCPQIREDMAEYMTTVEEMDRALGVVLNALQESGHAGNTVVVFTVDHGISFPYMKCNLMDSGMGVGLIMDFPDNPARGKAVDGIVSQLDIFPTLCELVGKTIPEYVQGTSMMPLFDDPEVSIREELFAEVTYHAGYEPMRCIRTDRYKLIRHFNRDRRINPVNIDRGYAKDFMAEQGLFNFAYDETRLYDLIFDPHEGNNLANRPEFSELRNDLEQRLENWMKETDDPLLDGPVSLPEGGKLNPRSHLHPDPKCAIIGPWKPDREHA